MHKPERTISSYTDRIYINGDWVVPRGSSLFEVIDSSTEEFFFRVVGADAHDINRAVAAARHAFDHGPWPRMPVRERAAFLRQFADAIRARSTDLAHVWVGETGTTRSFAETLMAGTNNFDDHAALIDEIEFEEVRTSKAGGKLGLLIREPVGVVGAIIPWNIPAWSIAIKAAPALLAGCTIVVKAAPEAPGEAYLLAEIAAEIGLPPGVFNILTADRDVSELLVRHPNIDKIAFTGSVAAGRRIASICGERIARVSLELGGKSPAIILEDYDVGIAAREIASKMPILSGQVCSALTRLIVPRALHDDFVEALVAAFKAIKVGNPYDLTTQMGPVANAAQRDRIMAYIATGKAEGGVLATGGGRPKDLDRGYFIEPTVFANVGNHHTIAREEIFGPVVAVIPSDSEEQSIAMANDSQFGLNASVFTNDVERAYAIGRRLRSGSVGHNGWRTDHSIAFGGFKQSGLGREGGREGIHEFLEVKTFTLEGVPAHLQ